MEAEAFKEEFEAEAYYPNRNRKRLKFCRFQAVAALLKILAGQNLHFLEICTFIFLKSYRVCAYFSFLRNYIGAFSPLCPTVCLPLLPRPSS